MASDIARAYERYQAGDLSGAERLCRQSLAADDNLADGWLLLGVLADHAKHPADAERFVLKAAALAPGEVRIWNTLGTIRDGTGDLDGAIAAYEDALRIRPDYAAALHNLGEVYRSLGEHRRAADQYRKALRVDPHLAPAHSNFLFCLHFDPLLSDAEIWEEHRRWGESVAERVAPLGPASNRLEPDRDLVIGYISPDFREHAVSRFFEPLLAAHDRRRHRYVLYSECPIIDIVGQRLRSHGDTWRVIRGQSADRIAQQIRADGVDILIELAGHTRDNRLDVMTLRPASVQMTFLGYPFPTGSPRIDYRITDSILDPLEAPVRSGLGESLLRMPAGVCCFQPPIDSPPVNALPLLKNEFITFGCHHPLTKLNPPLLKLWSDIAAALPSARFLCVRNSWDGAAARELKARLSTAGLPLDRIELRKTSIAPGDYLNAFAEMDMVLDAVPFNGHTMTCESLWMGVPVLTLRGDRPAGRLSSSVLTTLGLTAFIAETPTEYVAKAVAFANAAPQLQSVRQSLRQRMRDVLGDGRRFAGPLENLFREAWRTWCRSQRNLQRTKIESPKPAIAPATWNDIHTRGCQVLEAGDAESASELFRQASLLNPAAVPPRAMLAGILSDRCDLSGAADQFQLALRAGPDPKVRIAAAAVLPPIYDDHSQMAECRAKLIANLEVLHADGVRLDPMRGPIPNLFLIAYQGGNDRAVMESFAKLYSPPAWATEPLSPPPAADCRLRVGILSQYLCNHTIGTLNRGMVERLNRKRFHVTVLAATRNDDETSRIYKQHADHYVELPADTAAAVRLVRGLNLDRVLFTDLGMSCVTLALAHARLAPRQAVAWGHPLTTGIATIDDFVSAKVFEVGDAQDHYTEKLVKLNGINTYYPRPVLERTYTRSEFNLAEDVRLLGCPQTLFKMHPDIDAVFKAILENDPAARLVLIEGRNLYWKQRLLQRWQRTMPKAISQLIWLPTLDKARFLGLCSLFDAMLDPLHFGGGNTSLEALALGVPVVTLPSPYLRARLTAGFYKQIGFEDLIASDERDYIRIASDVDSLKQAGIEIRSKSHLLFEHAESVAAFEEYFSE